MLFAMIAKDRPGSGEERAAARPAHLQHLERLGSKVVLAGALLDRDGIPEGSLIVVEAASLEAATAELMADPFIEKGIFASTEIRPWRIAINHTGREH